MTAERYRVGELARRTGVSVRALHHYDAIGLLRPSCRSRAGYRLYSPEDVVRLQQIRSLRSIGLSLDEIGDLLDRGNIIPLQAIEMQRGHLRERIALEQRLLARLDLLAQKLSTADAVSAAEFMDTIEVMTMTENVEAYYTPEQLAELRERADRLGPERIREVEDEWPALIAQVRSEMERGTDPRDARVQALGRRWRELIAEFTGGNPEIGRSLQRMYDNEPEARARAGLDPELSAYVARMLESER